MLRLVIATRNQHKFRELTRLLAVRGIRWVSLAACGRVPVVRETGKTCEANAIKKAVAAARATGCPAVADDSGIEVEALRWGPGVRSARFSGRHGDDGANNTKLLRLLQGMPSGRRRARYRCVLALAEPPPSRWRRSAGRGRRPAGPSGLIAIAHGTWYGRIAVSPKGRRGFGYDPLFVVPRYGKTVGELPAATKQRVSHRAIAARRLRTALIRLVQRRRSPASFALLRAAKQSVRGEMPGAGATGQAP